MLRDTAIFEIFQKLPENLIVLNEILNPVVGGCQGTRLLILPSNFTSQILVIFEM